MTLEAESQGQDLVGFLRQRGLVATTSNGVEEHLSASPTSVYCGFDPTAESLQLGNLVPLITLRWLQERGHRPIIVIGGGTGVIGDPSGRSAERPMADRDTIKNNAESLKRQMGRYLDFDDKSNGAIVVNNADWLGEMSVLDFMREVGKLLSATRIRSLESISTRWERGEEGISLAEFVYTALQAFDFVHLYKNYSCTTQIGGSDQWGNITIGIDLVRKMTGSRAYGMTAQLLLDESGAKLGKTANQRIWLDASKTSSFALHQYLLQTTDGDADRWLGSLTTLPDDRMSELREQHRQDASKRIAQRALADSIVGLAHGAAGLETAHRFGSLLYSGDVSALQEGELRALASEAGIGFLHTTGSSTTITDLIVGAGLAASKREAREHLMKGAIYWNGQRLAVPDTTPANDLATLVGHHAVLRRGLRRVRVVAFA